MMKVMIVESPIKAKRIREIPYFSEGWEILPTYGHIEDLPEKEFGISINEEERTLEVYYKITKPQILNQILNAVNSAQEVYLATDPDREGEAIAYQVFKRIAHLSKQVFRITFNAVTERDILEALKNRRSINFNLVEAQTARRVIDRLIGYVLSPLAIKKYDKTISVGRVQSPAVNFVREREKEVLTHIKTPFWVIEAVCFPIYFAGLNNSLRVVSSKSFSSYHEAKEVYNRISGKFQVSGIKRGSIKVKPPKPLITAKLLSEAFRRFGYSAKKTMKIAQKLYERGYCTYVRTDSSSISKEGQALAKEYISKNYGEQYYCERAFVPDVFSQEAHECIRPTPTTVKFPRFTEEEKRILGLISEYFYASQMADAVYEQTEVELENEGEKFNAVGRKLIFDGFLKHFKGDYPLEVRLPPVEKEQILYGNVYIRKLSLPSPRLYSEADLIEKLYEKKIGRPSTYVFVIESIKERGYVKGSNALRTTGLADYLLDFLNNPKYNFILDEDYTRKLEENLDKVALGQLTKEEVIFDVYEKLKPAIKQGALRKLVKC